MTKFLPSRDFRVRQFGRGEPADQLRTAVGWGNAFFCTPPSAELGFVDEPTLGSTPPSRFPCTCVRCFGAAVGIYGRGACEYAREWREERPVGDDFGDEEQNVLRDRGINTDDVEHVQGGKTFFWRGHYDYDLNVAHTDDTQLNVFGDFQPKLSARLGNHGVRRRRPSSMRPRARVIPAPWSLHVMRYRPASKSHGLPAFATCRATPSASS